MGNRMIILAKMYKNNKESITICKRQNTYLPILVVRVVPNAEGPFLVEFTFILNIMSFSILFMTQN